MNEGSLKVQGSVSHLIYSMAFICQILIYKNNQNKVDKFNSSIWDVQ